MAVEISELDAKAAHDAIPELARVLADCVAGGASVSFMSPFSEADARGFFERVANEVETGTTKLLVARVDERIEGTVQLGLDTPPNQPHRGDIKKLLVHRGARRRGVAEALMNAVEDVARANGRWLLVLDTVRGEAGERVYARLGWQRTGIIPDYALFPDGRLCDTVVFWKKV